MRAVSQLALAAALSAAAGAPAEAVPLAHRPTVLGIVRLPFTSSASPAVGDTDGDGKPDIAVTSDNIGDITRSRVDPRNVNQVALYRWRDGHLQMASGWPRHTPDATLGLSMADLNEDGRDEVLAACGQDFAPPLVKETGTWLVSRLYVWHGDGTPMPPWSPTGEDTRQGLTYGHAYAAPVVADINRDARPEILHASQGEWINGGFQHGGLRVYSASGAMLSRTQGEFVALPWYTLPGFAMDAPPVLADLNGDGRSEVVAATYGGSLYAWTPEGTPVPGWPPASRAKTHTTGGALLRGGIAAGDINGDGKDEVLAGAYDGALYFWDGRGRLLWRSPASLLGTTAPALTSGVALGRLRRSGSEVNAVVGDASGKVTAWDPKGRIRWRVVTTPGFPIEAEPAIGDVNGDGTQDVVVGGTDGYVYAYDGETGYLLWRMPTFAAPTQQGMRLESVFGAPALCDIRGNGHMNVIVATAQRYIADAPAHAWKGFGHVIVLDCGPGTYNASRLDWPQYRQNAHRTGRFSPPK